jgi:uncharacterized protein YyaL (SSP411 family)
MVTKGIRFSPRPNRAHEINWTDWGPEPLQRAEREGKLVLLAISGVWCHWCHVMDEQTYSDPQVIALINERFVPVRVDTDMRPDINARYNMGGWPTTCILNPAGEVLAGGTYIPPEQCRRWLEAVERIYREDRDKVEARLAELSEEYDEEQELRAEFPPLTWELYQGVLQQVLELYDSIYGGFGKEPKFPMIDALQLLLTEHERSGAKRPLEICLHSLGAMATGGMYDEVEGGFFRYSTTRDWTIPHFEKMLEDNALLLGILARAYRITADDDCARVAGDVVRYLTATLYLPEVKCWAGSQDADEEYYALPLAERRQRPAPFVDKRVYVDWNAHLARALLLSGRVFGENSWQEMGLATLKELWERCYRENYGMAHYFWHGGEPGLYGGLADATAMGQACNQAYQETAEPVWLERAQALARYVIAWLPARSGGFYDYRPDPAAPGALARPRRDLIQNAAAALWLLELSALTDEQKYAETAKRALQSFVSEHGNWGIMASEFARAIAAALTPWRVLNITGDPATVARPLWEAARQSLADNLVLRAGEAEMDAQAFLCLDDWCLAPVQEPAALAQLLEETRQGELR